MTNSSIKINMSGGSANFGAIVSGNNARVTVDGQSLTGGANRAFADATAALDTQLAQQSADREQIEALKDDLVELKSAIGEGHTTRWGTLHEASQALDETYKWAAPILTTLFTALRPIFGF